VWTIPDSEVPVSLPTVVITDCDHPTTAPEEEVLAGRAALVVHRRHDPAGLVDICRDADGIITQYGAFTPSVLGALPRCRVIARYGVGVDTVDLAAATARGIVVANVPDYGTEEVSTHAIALVLALHRRLLRFDRAVKGGVWDFAVGAPIPRLSGLTLGVIGFGRIGSTVAHRLHAFGLTVVASDPYVTAFPDWVKPLPLDDLLAVSDVVSIHCPLTPETHHLLDERALRRLKPTAILVNTARGGIVDTAALARTLAEGRIAGAGIDVLEHEPLPADHPLASLDNVLLTPHAAFYSEGSILELKRKVARAVLDVLEGRRPASVVNPEVYAPR
jgi:D-3-phosphoglycerate dehydrogenase